MVSGDMRAMYKEKKTKMIIIRLWIGNDQHWMSQYQYCNSAYDGNDWKHFKGRLDIWMWVSFITIGVIKTLAA